MLTLFCSCVQSSCCCLKFRAGGAPHAGRSSLRKLYAFIATRHAFALSMRRILEIIRLFFFAHLVEAASLCGLSMDGLQGSADRGWGSSEANGQLRYRDSMNIYFVSLKLASTVPSGLAVDPRYASQSLLESSPPLTSLSESTGGLRTTRHKRCHRSCNFG